MTTREIIDLEQKYILQTYGRPEFVLEKGDGVHIVDTDGKHYLDFVSGLSVNALGYNNAMIQEAANAQLGKLIPCFKFVSHDSGASVGAVAVRAFVCRSRVFLQ